MRIWKVFHRGRPVLAIWRRGTLIWRLWPVRRALARLRLRLRARSEGRSRDTQDAGALDTPGLGAQLAAEALDPAAGLALITLRALIRHTAQALSTAGALLLRAVRMKYRAEGLAAPAESAGSERALGSKAAAGAEPFTARAGASRGSERSAAEAELKTAWLLPIYDGQTGELHVRQLWQASESQGTITVQ